MILTSIDSIVRNNLLRQGKPLHFYLQELIYAVECLSEITMDDLQVIHTQILPVNNYNAVDLPSGYVDKTGVFLKVGQKLQPLTEDNSISPLNNFDTDFNIIRFDSVGQANSSDQSVVYINGLLNTYFYGFAPYDSLGEPLGRIGGIGNPTNNTYKIVKERNQIQLNENLSVDNIVLQYIGDGRNADSVSSIESYALSTIRAYIDYRVKDFNRSYSRGEVEQARQMYLIERKTLRGRKSNLTMTALRQIVYKNYRLSASK